jgi:hypothetical protein
VELVVYDGSFREVAGEIPIRVVAHVDGSLHLFPFMVLESCGVIEYKLIVRSKNETGSDIQFTWVPIVSIFINMVKTDLCTVSHPISALNFRP